MHTVFYATAAVVIIATILAVGSRNVVHALLYLIVSFLGVAVVFFILGAPFAAALEAIVYAGAIMVLFVFVVMMLNMGPRGEGRHEDFSAWTRPRTWLGPAALTILLGIEFVWTMLGETTRIGGFGEVSATTVGIELLGPYMLGVEIASMLLLVGLIGAYHIGRRCEPDEENGKDTEGYR